MRSEILMESPAEVEDADPLSRLPDDLSPQQLRDLADVEQARREGRITEAEYRRDPAAADRHRRVNE